MISFVDLAITDTGASSAHAGVSQAFDSTGALGGIIAVTITGQTSALSFVTAGDNLGNAPAVVFMNGGSAYAYFLGLTAVGPGHVITALDIASSDPFVQVLCFSATGTLVFDSRSQALDTSGPLAPGSLTPSGAPALLVSGTSLFCSDAPGLILVTGGFAPLTEDGPTVPAAAAGIGYLIQSVAAPANPAWNCEGTIVSIAAWQMVFVESVPPPPTSNGDFFALLNRD